MPGTDSAGVPWEGRHFEPNASPDDDGSAPEKLVEAIRRFHSHDRGEADVVDALRDSRLLIPLVAQLGADGVTEHGHGNKLIRLAPVENHNAIGAQIVGAGRRRVVPGGVSD